MRTEVLESLVKYLEFFNHRMREPLKAFTAKKYNCQICISKKKNLHFRHSPLARRVLKFIRSEADSKGYDDIQETMKVTELLTAEIKVRSRPRRVQ